MVIQQLIVPQTHDLGSFSVRRSLPHEHRQMVGPFIFFDHLGPANFPPGEGIDVRPHPHINLATVTYLFEGSLLHRDSLGVVQEILPGEVNWMTAGKGVVHSERSPDAFRANQSTLHAIQTWIALPDGDEEIEPSFSHHDVAELPRWTESGTDATLIAGDFESYTSPVKTFSPTLYLSLDFSTGSRFRLPRVSSQRSQERAVYSVTEGLLINGVTLDPHCLAIVDSQAAVEIEATADTQCMVIGGQPVGPRYKDWNFVSSRRQRIEQAKADWRSQRFDPVPGETEFIPLPQ